MSNKKKKKSKPVQKQTEKKENPKIESEKKTPETVEPKNEEPVKESAPKTDTPIKKEPVKTKTQETKPAQIQNDKQESKTGKSLKNKSDALREKLIKYEPLWKKIKKYCFALYFAAALICFISSFLMLRSEFRKSLKIISTVANETIAENPQNIIGAMKPTVPQQQDEIEKYLATTDARGGMRGQELAENAEKVKNGIEKAHVKNNWFVVILAFVLIFTGIATLFKAIDELYIFIRNKIIKYKMDNNLY